MSWNLFRTKSVAELSATLDGPNRLPRVLGRKELIFLGIGAVIGAGIFSTLGSAAVGDPNVGRLPAGPALPIAFILAGVACMFAALCYSELTAMIPISGSAYTYAFATLGELAAWIIGWDLLLEYAIGNIGVAIAWSAYFDTVLHGLGLDLPRWLMMSHGDVMQQLGSREEILAQLVAAGDATPAAIAAATGRVEEMQSIVANAPNFFGWAAIINIPAIAITLAITWLLVRGVRESAKANNVMVIVKLGILALFVGVGMFNVDPANWHPFLPGGWTGVFQAAAVVFFAFIGFDAVSTAAEEAKDPQRTMPFGILGSLAICSVIYVIVSAVATGLVPFRKLGEAADPLPLALEGAGLPAVQWVVALGAAVAMAAVLLVFQYGQPRILYSMSRDGLLPKWCSRVHPKYQTPHVTTILTGLVVAVGAAIWDDDAAYSLTNIGTLFAFVIVSIGVLILRVTNPEVHRPFRVPFIWVTVPLSVGSCAFLMYYLPIEAWERFGIWLAIGVLIYVIRKLTMKPEPRPAR